MFTGKELEVIKLSQKTLHDSINVLLESFDLVLLVIALEVSHDPLHVVLQIVHVVSLLSEPSLDQSVIEDKVDPRLHGLLCALISLLSASVGALENKV